MGLDWTQLPEKRDPFFGHPAIPSTDQGVDNSSESIEKSRRTSQAITEEASFVEPMDRPQNSYRPRTFVENNIYPWASII